MNKELLESVKNLIEWEDWVEDLKELVSGKDEIENASNFEEDFLRVKYHLENIGEM